MIKMTVFYENFVGAKFNRDYYRNEHLKLLREILGDELKRVEVDWGLTDPAQEYVSKYLVIGHLFFESIESFNHSYLPYADYIHGDVRNYTNIQPTVQISITDVAV